MVDNARKDGMERPSLENLLVKATTDALSLFGGWYFYAAEEVNRYLEFSEVKYLFLAASIWLIIADMFYNNYRDGENCVLKIKYYNLKLPITLIWIIPLIITFICGLIVYQKLDSLDMNALRFFKQFIVFMIVSYFGSIILKRFFNRIKDKNTSRIMVVRRD
jgi:uncharacterized protein YacL